MVSSVSGAASAEQASDPAESAANGFLGFAPPLERTDSAVSQDGFFALSDDTAAASAARAEAAQALMGLQNGAAKEGSTGAEQVAPPRALAASERERKAAPKAQEKVSLFHAKTQANSQLKYASATVRAKLDSHAGPSSEQADPAKVQAAIATPRPRARPKVEAKPSGPIYEPRRHSPAQSVLVPMPPDQLESIRAGHRNPLRKAAASPPVDPGQPSKFVIGAIAQSHASGVLNGQPSKKRGAADMMGDVRDIAEHYNKRQNTNVAERKQSPIIGLRSLNNWIKSVLIDQYCRYPTVGQGEFRTAIKVLDMGCGKGGDLRKWVIAKVDEYIGLDIAETSIEQAYGRWNAMRDRFPAIFTAMDCFTDSITNHLDPAALQRPFDTVSMQFCMHYAFSSQASARVMLENVSRFLRPGGTFVGTIPDSTFLLRELYSLPEDVTDFSFGNSVYKITFDERPEMDDLPLYGHRYSFYLQDAVDNVPEYIVHWDNFVDLASEYGLQMVFHRTFHDLFEEFSEQDAYKAMLTRMGVVNADNESELTEEQWEIANVYVAFAFVKRSE